MNLIFFSRFFLLIEFWQIKQKVENGSCSIDTIWEFDVEVAEKFLNGI
jgi:hypothetical protein